MSENTNHIQPFTFQSTGITIHVRPVSPMLLNEARKSVQRPTPPMQAVESADGTTRQEPNPSHPDHVAALRDYNERVGLVAQRVMIGRGVVLALSDEQRAALADLREEMATLGVTLDSDDKLAYVLNIACGTAEDLSELVQAITQRGQPTDPKSQSG